MKKPKSKIPFLEGLAPEKARSAASLLSALAALGAVTCAGAAPGPASPAAGSEPAPAAEARPDGAVTVVEPDASAFVAAEGPPPPERPSGAPLSRYFAALSDLEHGRRTEHVRVLWFGDSHTAADFWPDAVRAPLQARFGNGGPGFTYVGLKVHRHAGIAFTREGAFRQEPKLPSYWKRQEDGVFGLGGIRMVPKSTESSVTLTLQAGAVTGRARWELSYGLPSADAAFDVQTDAEKTRLDAARSAGAERIAHFAFETEPGATVRLTGASGLPELFGVVVESATPGVVVDTLGINGARVGTPLGWEPEAWEGEVARRNPALVVLAYGTNEVGDAVAPFRYGAEYDELVGRLRRAAPGADCLLIGPTDRASPDWSTNPRVLEIEAVQREAAQRLGCAFVSAVELMGGAGSLKRWSEASPPLASADRIHLTVAGYRELGAAASRFFLEPGLGAPSSAGALSAESAEPKTAPPGVATGTPSSGP